MTTANPNLDNEGNIIMGGGGAGAGATPAGAGGTPATAAAAGPGHFLLPYLYPQGFPYLQQYAGKPAPFAHIYDQIGSSLQLPGMFSGSPVAGMGLGRYAFASGAANPNNAGRNAYWSNNGTPLTSGGVHPGGLLGGGTGGSVPPKSSPANPGLLGSQPFPPTTLPQPGQSQPSQHAITGTPPTPPPNPASVLGNLAPDSPAGLQYVNGRPYSDDPNAMAYVQDNVSGQPVSIAPQYQPPAPGQGMSPAQWQAWILSLGY